MELACVPGCFAEDAFAKFHPTYGNGILLPAVCAERIIEETSTELLAVFEATVNGTTHYMTLAGYGRDEYTYIPGSLLGDDFNPGELMTLEIVKNVGHAGTLYLDCDWFDNAKEILERWLGDVYRVVYPGMVIKTDDGYSYPVKKVINTRGVEIPIGLAIDTDMEIIFGCTETGVIGIPNDPDPYDDLLENDPIEEQTDIDDLSSIEDDIEPLPIREEDPSAEERKPTLAELRAMRLAYFNRTH